MDFGVSKCSLYVENHYHEKNQNKLKEKYKEEKKANTYISSNEASIEANIQRPLAAKNSSIKKTDIYKHTHIVSIKLFLLYSCYVSAVITDQV